MSVAHLLADVARLGIKLETHGDRLRYCPRSAVTPELVERLKAHKPELLALLRADAPGQWQPAWLDLDWIERVGPDGRRSLIHPAHVDHEWEEIGELEPCHNCGGFELWWTLAGTWRCLRCDPPTTARRVMEAAARIRAEKPKNDTGQIVQQRL